MRDNECVKKFLENSIRFNARNIFEAPAINSSKEGEFEQNIFSHVEIEKATDGFNLHAKDDIKAQRRLNDLDADILNKSAKNEIAITNEEFEKIFQKTDSKQHKGIFYNLLPDFYKRKMLNEEVKKLKYLNKVASELSKKQIPYGEEDARYSHLVDYLTEANSIRSKFNS